MSARGWRLKIIALVFILTATAALLVRTSLAEGPYPPTPEMVVKAFCDGYAGGQGLGTASEEIYKYTSWADSPGWDRISITQSYRIEPVQLDSRAAKISITYINLGFLDSGPSHLELHLLEAHENVLVTLLKVDGIWKISKPLLPPHIGVAAAIKLLEADMTSLPKAERTSRQKEINLLKRVGN